MGIDPEVDEIVLRAAYAFNETISVGQKIMAETFCVLRKLRGLCNEEEFKFSDEQGILFSKEVAKLSLFWITRDVWTYIVKDELEAKKVNLLLCSWFKNKFGVDFKEIEEYARAAGTSEEVQIYGKNVAKIFNCYGAIEILEINTVPVGHFKEHLNNLKNAFEMPIKDVSEAISSKHSSEFQNIKTSNSEDVNKEKKICPRCGHKNPQGAFRCKNEDCLDILPQND